MFPIWKFGSEEQKQEWLPRMAAGEVDRLLRPHRARLAAATRPACAPGARRDGDDWILNGTKMWITNGGIADVAVVWADETPDGAGAIHGFIVPTDTPGLHGQRHPPEALAAGLDHLRARARRRAPARLGAPARGVHHARPAVVPQRGPLRHLLGRHRRRRGPATRRPSTTPSERAPVRQADRLVPADPAQARRDDGAGEQGAARGAAPRAHEGPGPARPRPR